MALIIKQVCWQCSGSGIFSTTRGEEEVTTDPCNICGGFGRITLLEVHLPEGYFFTNDIIENTLVSEYLALTDEQKSRYNVIISATIVGIYTGSAVKHALWQLFGEGTTTRAKLKKLIN